MLEPRSRTSSRCGISSSASCRKRPTPLAPCSTPRSGRTCSQMWRASCGRGASQSFDPKRPARPLWPRYRATSSTIGQQLQDLHPFLGNAAVGRDGRPQEEEFYKLEATVSAATLDLPCVAISMFDLRTQSAHTILKAAFEGHPVTIHRNCIRENPLYVPRAAQMVIRGRTTLQLRAAARNILERVAQSERERPAARGGQ